MAFSHGSSANVKIKNRAGTLTDVTAYVDKGEMQRMCDKAETTVLGLSAKTFIPGLKDTTFTMQGKFDPTMDDILDAALTVAVGTTKTLNYSPAGTATGNPTYAFEVFCTAYPIPFDVNGALTFSATFQCTGNVTRTVN
jgi:hypothetical protein